MVVRNTRKPPGQDSYSYLKDCACMLQQLKTDPGWFTYQLENRIWFWSSAAWPKTSCTWAFPLCILVLYEELIPSLFLNSISPSSLLSLSSNGLEINKPPRGLNNGFTVSKRTITDFTIIDWIPVSEGGGDVCNWILARADWSKAMVYESIDHGNIVTYHAVPVVLFFIFLKKINIIVKNQIDHNFPW